MSREEEYKLLDEAFAKLVVFIVQFRKLNPHLTSTEAWMVFSRMMDEDPAVTPQDQTTGMLMWNGAWAEALRREKNDSA